MKPRIPLFDRHVSVLFLTVMLFSALSCSFFGSMKDDGGDDGIAITSLAVGKSALSMKVGSMDYVSVSVKPQTEQKNIRLNWSYDESIIECDTSSNWGVTIKALAEGQTSLRCSYGGYDATCLVTVQGFEEGYEVTTEPYIYSNTTVLQTSPGVTEKVFVSLYGGDASDIDGYTWTADSPSVAAIQPTGQYCMITAKDPGYTRIKVTHTKAAYPYYIGVYVFEDATNVAYITTQHNILTMNKDSDEQEISVALVNGKDSSLDASFVWQIEKQDSTAVPIGIDYNGNRAIIKPLESGSCTIRITHPDAPYPLDILCRVITVVKNVYIQPDSTIVYLNGAAEQTVTASLKNIDVSEYSVDDYEYMLENDGAAEIVSSIGNQVIIRGVANGSCKLVISHPKSEYPREVLLIVTGQLRDAVDASRYITTSQNYIRTKVGADTTQLSVSLKGGDDGDERNFVWSVKGNASDGTSEVIRLETADGSAVHARAAAATYAYGTAHITPLAEGTAVITVSHPKIVYPTEILVKVLGRDAILEEQLYFTGSGLVRILNGESAEYRVELKGTGKVPSDDSLIRWAADDSRLSVTGNGASAVISAPPQGSGQTMSRVTASHSKADADKSVLVLTADDEETLMSMRALYSDKLYYNIEVGDAATVMASTVGFEPTEEGVSTDLSALTWKVKDPSVITAERDADNPLLCTVRGLKAGVTTLAAAIDGCSCEFTVTVYPVGTVAVEPEVYFTTYQNVVVLGGAGKSATVSVNAVNLRSSGYPFIGWQSGDDGIAKVVPNGTKATVTAMSEGETIITVSHPDSQNELKIYVRVGSEYILPDTEPVTYISAPDVVTMLRGDPAQKLQAVLVNGRDNGQDGFSFSSDNRAVVEVVSQSANGTAYIKPNGSGQAEITVSHPAAENTKKVLVIVGNSAEELAGFTYLTTGSNVVAVGEGSTKTVSVRVQNAESIVVDGYNWTSSNQDVVGVIASGATALLKGNGIGTAIITVTNRGCKYPLQIIAQVVDPIAASANPYIQLTSSVMTLTVGSAYASVSAELVGGTESDLSGFTWSTNNPGIATVYGQNEVGKIRALSAGTTYITVSHPKAAYPAQLLVVCDEAVKSDCYISVPSSIIAMKPTDSSQTVTANLINGSATDKYNFSWSLDVYDIIDFQYSANVCTITPKQSGSVTVTVSHPKAAYDQKIIVNVQQYATFAFPSESMTVTQGDVKFLPMQVPVTNVATHVEYSVDNQNICSVSGTKTTAQLTAVGTGTTTVRARLVATGTGTEQASSEMMVYVKEKPVNAVYITSSSTITTVAKGKSQTLSATLTGTGVVTSDQQNLKWTTSDTDVVQIAGIKSDGTVTGQSIYVTALKAGEALITCSHEKAASDLQFYVVVPGSAEKVVTLNKSYMTLTKGSSGATLKATIENAESNSDYNNLIWTCEGANGAEIARVMGSGQSVTIYPLAVGEATVMVQLPDSPIIAKCTVLVEAGKSFAFEVNARRVGPKHSKTVKYKVSPPDAVLTWSMAQQDDYFTYSDLGCDKDGNGQVEIIGLKEGNGTLACVTDGMAKGQVAVTVSWDYEFTVGATRFSGSPDKTYLLEYSVNPADAVVEVSGNGLCEFSQTTDGLGNGKIEIMPHTEGTDSIIVRARNPNDSNKEIGSYTVAGSFYYDSLTVRYKKQGDVSYADNTKSAWWSSFENDVITLGDGEKMTFAFEVAEAKTKDLTITASLQSKRDANILLAPGATDGQFILSHKADTQVPAYRINKGYRPTFKGSTSYPDGTPIKLTDFSSVTWSDCDWHCVPFDNHYTRILKYLVRNDKVSSNLYALSTGWNRGGTHTRTLSNKEDKNGDWGVVRDTSLDGACYSVEEFQKYVWYYVPQFQYDDGGEDTIHLVHQYGEIDTDHIDATYQAVTTDTAVVSSSQADVLVVTFEHNGKQQKKQYPIYVEVRNSSCTQK